MALGQVIVRELELNDRGNTLERWLAHHLAELIATADSAAGEEKERAEQRAVDLILRLWLHRRALPTPVDPLGGYREAIAVLGRLVPDANPWKNYRRKHTYEGLLQEMFESVSRIMVGGLLLTQLEYVRALSDPEAAALEPEEKFFAAEFEKWMQSIPPRPDFQVMVISDETANGSEDEADRAELQADDLTPEEQMARLELNTHASIASYLESLQDDLDELLNRWRTAGPPRPQARSSATADTDSEEGD